MERNNYCANCKSYMLHATGETCSAYCRDQLEVRRAAANNFAAPPDLMGKLQPVTLEQLERAEVWINQRPLRENVGDITVGYVGGTAKAPPPRIGPLVVEDDGPPINVRAWRWAAVIFAAGAWLALLVLAIILWGPK